MTAPDATHDPQRTSWVASANGHAEFPIQNLPFGSFATADGDRRLGIAIGDSILDLRACATLGWFDGIVAREVLSQQTLNALMALGAPPQIGRAHV